MPINTFPCTFIFIHYYISLQKTIPLGHKILLKPLYYYFSFIFNTYFKMAHNQNSWLQFGDDHHHHIKNNEKCTSSSTTSSSIGEESMISNGSSSNMSSSADTADDASSSSSFNSNGSLYDLSDIMAQLPIKRGLSKFYQGKSESFTSLSRVTSIEDLAKKVTPYRKNMKSSKSCGNGLNNSFKNYTLPKAIISKKATRGSCLSSFPSKRVGFSKSPVTPLHKNLF